MLKNVQALVELCTTVALRICQQACNDSTHVGKVGEGGEHNLLRKQTSESKRKKTTHVITKTAKNVLETFFLLLLEILA